MTELIITGLVVWGLFRLYWFFNKKLPAKPQQHKEDWDHDERVPHYRYSKPRDGVTWKPDRKWSYDRSRREKDPATASGRPEQKKIGCLAGCLWTGVGCIAVFLGFIFVGGLMAPPDMPRTLTDDALLARSSPAEQERTRNVARDLFELLGGPVPGGGNWIVNEKPSGVYVSLVTRTGTQCTTEPVYVLGFACEDNRTEAEILFDDCSVVVPGERKDVTVKFDDNEPISKSMSRGRHESVLVLPKGRASIQFARQIMGTNTLTVTTHGTEGQIRVFFDSHGLDEAIKPLRRACNW